MKTFRWIFAMVLLLMATNSVVANEPDMENDYNNLWKQADSLAELRQPRAAMEVVDEIHSLARQDNNVPQAVRAQLYRLKLSSEFEENYMVNAIEKIRDEIESAQPPEQQLLHSILGEMYFKYYQFNRYKILNRTATVGLENTDIEVWDVNRIMEEASRQFSLSLEQPDELKKLNIRSFAPILEEEKGSQAFRPTLFDFLAWRAIDFYLNEESNPKVVSAQFIPKDEKYFGPAATFVEVAFPEEFVESPTVKVLSILQDLLDFHLNDKNPHALVDADLKRLEIIHQKAVLPEKDGFYLKALEKLQDDYKASEVSADVAFQMARFHHQQASKYQPLVSEEYRWENKKAVSICEEAIKAFPESTGANNCRVLMERIREVSLQVKVENAVIPGKPSLGLLSWKNFGKAWFRLVKLDYEAFTEMTRQSRREEVANKLAGQRFMKAWSLSLPGEKDYQVHSAEFGIPAVSPGFYILLVSSLEAFEGGQTKLAWAEFWSTGLSSINQRLDEGGYDLYVLDRESGKQKSGVTLSVYKRDYDYRKREYQTTFLLEKVTDGDGFAKIDADNGVRGGVFIELKDREDRYIPDQNLYLTRPHQREDKPREQTFFFTDRSIYRPGQLVYFKAIVMEKTGDKYEIKKDASTKVEFYDANNQLVSSLDLTTNDYGSVNGTFTIPSGLLNGQMQIRNQSGNADIRVEEYKRPNFEVTFKPVEGSYKLSEEITVTGTAYAYAGNSIGNAEVSYRIVRNVFHPWPLRWGYIYPPQQPVEIATGKTETDADGNFEITFKAIPDYTGGQNVKQSFSFQITADVTDINGETQSGETSVNVGSEAMVLNVDIPQHVNRQKLSGYEISATNLNGQKLDTDVDIKIYTLTPPAGLLKDRYWEQPDEFIIPEQEFREKFPNRVYRDESDPANWEKGKVALEMSVNTAVDSILPGGLMEKWEQGNYLVEMKATDVFGTEVQTEKVFTFFDPEAMRPPVITYHWFEALKSKCEPGEQAELLIGSLAKNVQIIYEIQYKGETLQRKWLKLSNEQELISIPIEESYRGNITFHYRFAKDNRMYSGSQIIEVPYTNKKLDLSFETLRTELEPGGREKWTVTIRDKAGDRVAAEMLASMYDASLDAFVDHKWNLDLYRSYNQINGWQTGKDFSLVNGKTWDFERARPGNYIFNQYDRLNWFGLSPMQSYVMRDMAGGVKGVEAMEMQPAPNEEMAEAGMSEPSGDVQEDGMALPPEEEKATGEPELQLRRDFNETAFFYPQLRTNKEGNVVIEFTLPESFTRWKFMGLSHTTNLMTGFLRQEFTAAKKLMIVPNSPRFFREGDTLYYSAKITNLSGEKLDGHATLQFFDAVSMREITGELLLTDQSKRFNVENERSTSVSWKMAIPQNPGAVTYRIKATTRNFTDGEERSIPVLPNRMMVTEAMPMPIRGNETKDFAFDRLIESGKSETLQNYRLTLEFASNPAWYAVQALPVISEVKYNNAVSVFSALFANSIAFHITNQNPEIKRVFNNWKTETPESFLSKLEKNQDLKQVLLEQTPWVLNAKDEKDRKQRIAMLFDLNNMQNRLDNSIRLLEKFQKPNGGFCWMNEMRESRYITQMIVQGLGRLHHMGVLDAITDQRLNRLLTSAVRYLDREIHDDYERLKERNPEKMEENHLSSTHVQYLYARSFFSNIMINPSHETAWNYYKHQASVYWTDQNNYLQGMIALALHRDDKTEAPGLILTSLRDRALHDDEMGMYWRGEPGYFWYRAPIETQAMMIEVFDEVAAEPEAVEEMKIWLLKQKQTQDWGSSRATADAVYALLSRGTNLLEDDQLVEIVVGGDEISPDDMGTMEAGTGYFQTAWDGNEIEPQMGNVTVTKPGDGIAWGAMYWQYFENLDKITQHETGLSVVKNVFVQRDTEEGRKIEPLEDGDKLGIGDQVVVRIEIRANRNMEFVHLRDLRASAFEPVNVLSGFSYQGGLGYYETTKDASTDFFFDYLPKGTYVFEYPLIASQAGHFSNGIATLQCMYAPEFVSHSEGIRVIVEE